ncbi:MAG: hypothetical protein ACR2LY_00785, partial [Thermoleophilaceae bacterium]
PSVERAPEPAPAPPRSAAPVVAERRSEPAPAAAVRAVGAPRAETATARHAEAVPAAHAAAPPGAALDLDRLRSLWSAALEEVATQNAMVAALLGEARPTVLESGRLTITFPPDHAFSRKKAESNRPLLQTALHGLTGHSLQIAYELGDAGIAEDAPRLTEEELLARLKDEFDARELLDDDEPEAGDPAGRPVSPE